MWVNKTLHVSENSKLSNLLHLYLQGRKLVYALPTNEENSEVVSSFRKIWKSFSGQESGFFKNQKMKKSLQGKRVGDLFFTFRHCGDKDDACLVIRHHSGEEVGIKLILLNLVFFASRWVEEISSFLTWESATVSSSPTWRSASSQPQVTLPDFCHHDHRYPHQYFRHQNDHFDQELSVGPPSSSCSVF